MALKADLSDLGAMPPDNSTEFTSPLFDHLEAFWDAEGDRPMAVTGSRFRHSWAGECARAAAYHMTHAEPTNPPDRVAMLTFALGTFVHDLWQAAMARSHPDIKIEVECELPDISSSGHADAQIGATVFEVKSINGFGFKNAVGERGKAEGPRTSAVLQGALNAKALEAETLVVPYVSLEAISLQAAARAGGMEVDRRMSAQWTFTRDQWEPMADAEIRRIEAVQDILDHGDGEHEVPRHIPGMPPGARVVDPGRGAWELRDLEDNALISTGSAWQCTYCPFQDRCINDKKAGM